MNHTSQLPIFRAALMVFSKHITSSIVWPCGTVKNSSIFLFYFSEVDDFVFRSHLLDHISAVLFFQFDTMNLKTCRKMENDKKNKIGCASFGGWNAATTTHRTTVYRLPICIVPHNANNKCRIICSKCRIGQQNNICDSLFFFFFSNNHPHG